MVRDASGVSMSSCSDLTSTLPLTLAPLQTILVEKTWTIDN